MASPSLDALLAPWVEDPTGAGILTDFDGTLAPIVDDPATAVALPGTAELLARLARRYRTVGVVSGRAVDYLHGRLRGSGEESGLVLSGLYGLERMEAGRRSVRPGAEDWSVTVEAAAVEADGAAPAGVAVERKGLTFTLHARRVPGKLDDLERYATDLAGRTGLEAVPGKMLVELRPPIDVDKGTIVAELATGLRAVCFAGDDVGDLPAFATLAHLRRAGLSTLSVAARSDETPDALLAAADIVVDGPAGVVEILERLAG